MKKINLLLLIPLYLLGGLSSVQAGHLFTQAATNTPVVLAAGQGVTIPQVATEGLGTPGNVSINLQNWSAGDQLRLIIGAYSQTFEFDNPLPGTSQGSTSLFIPTAVTGSLSGIVFPALPSNFRMENVAGDGFTLTGYRIDTQNVKLDGTGAGLVNQDQVTGNTGNVPLPGALILMGSSLFGLAFSRRKRNTIKPLVAATA